MKCEICGSKDPPLLMLLPIKQKDGKLETMACKKCAEKSSAYCKKHRRIHQGFIDGTTACLSCVEELVEANRAIADKISDRINDALGEGQLQDDLNEAAETASVIMSCTVEISILRFVSSKAARTNCTVEKVIVEVERKGSSYFLS